MISHFFIDRPIFASVLSIVFVLAGGVAVVSLPVSQYPEVSPPAVLVTAFYPGANSVTVRDVVAAPIEEQVSGVEGMMYMSSQATNDGTYRLLVTFNLGMDSDMAQVLVQNRVSLALPVIPALVQNEGITVKKMSPNTLMIVNLVSPDGRYDSTFLSNYATIYIRDELGRLPGIADISYFGQRDYSLRAWLDPDRLASLGLERGRRRQRHQPTKPSGGCRPDRSGAGAQGPAVPAHHQHPRPAHRSGRVRRHHHQGRRQQRHDASGRPHTGPVPQAVGIVRLRDVARVELGSQQYDQTCTLDGKPSVALNVFQLPGTNAIKTAQGVRDKMKELKKRFVDGLDYRIVYDTTPFIDESVREVYYTLIHAILLVALVMLVFLQSWRAAIIPLVAVPVAIVGTFAVMAALGFSLNNLSLFGLVLAIGIVVDDAIVVVENIERWLDRGVEPREAARRAMDEVTGPVIAVGLVLFAVFVPAAFLGGISGQFFRQFAVTIAVSTVISAFNSLTLSPALAAILLKPRHAHRDPLTWLMDLFLGWFFRLFNFLFGTATDLYVGVVRGMLRVSLVVLLLYGGLLFLTYRAIHHRPDGLHPAARQGLPALERAIARFRLRAAHRSRDGANREDRARNARRCPHCGHLRPIADSRRQRSEPGLDVRRARRFRRAPRSPAVGRRHRRKASRAVRARGGRGLRDGLRRPAHRRLRHDRRLQADPRTTRYSQPGRAAAGQPADHRPRQSNSRPARPVATAPAPTPPG